MFFTQLDFGPHENILCGIKCGLFPASYSGKYIQEETGSCCWKTKTNKETGQEGDLKRRK